MASNGRRTLTRAKGDLFVCLECQIRLSRGTLSHKRSVRSQHTTARNAADYRNRQRGPSSPYLTPVKTSPQTIAREIHAVDSRRPYRSIESSRTNGLGQYTSLLLLRRQLTSAATVSNSIDGLAHHQLRRQLHTKAGRGVWYDDGRSLPRGNGSTFAPRTRSRERLSAQWSPPRRTMSDAHGSVAIGQSATSTSMPAAEQNQASPAPEGEDGVTPNHTPAGSLRSRLRRWAEENKGRDDSTFDVITNDSHSFDYRPVNTSARLPEQRGDALRPRDLVSEDHDRTAHYEGASDSHDSGPGSELHPKLLNPGDLVELALGGERENTLAVFVRSLDESTRQFFTLDGKWAHVTMSFVRWRTESFVRPAQIQRLLEYLPSAEAVRDKARLQVEAYLEDLSVPREISKPIVTKLNDFHKEALAIYRKNAKSLDNAHSTLAHETDIQFGTLKSFAAALLDIKAASRTPATEYAIRLAIERGGFGFDVDKVSHVATGHVLIRSKEQVKCAEAARDMIHAWQDDLAISTMVRRFKSTKAAQSVYDFVHKAKHFIDKTRRTRGFIPTLGSIGPCVLSPSHAPPEPLIDSAPGTVFNFDDQLLIRFMETWACQRLLKSSPRLESLPPLLLQATGRYAGEDMDVRTGFRFLQEIGVLSPFENKIRFSPHLLLPGIGLSEPLDRLVQKVTGEQDDSSFQDSMAELRHDWGDMPVYCIDDADALEIDDGISIELDANGLGKRPHIWIHVHIANPTAFLAPNHDVVKVARHMRESLYFPEMAHNMLPNWTVRDHFSLQAGRPCLTFSARVEMDGSIVESKITSGRVHNVKYLTRQDVRQALGIDYSHGERSVVLTVGGSPPPSSHKGQASRVDKLSAKEVKDLEMLNDLAMLRKGYRLRGGAFILGGGDPKISVWAHRDHYGLEHDPPNRQKFRTFRGDPGIQVRAVPLQNRFAPEVSTGDEFVDEMMLLANNVVATWCRDRQLPIFYRGTVDRGLGDPAEFYENEVVPRLDASGVMPMHIGYSYLRQLGATVISPDPIRHRMLGMRYCKATSPLRRFGDMVNHWQIEAALRHEARTGESLVAPPGANLGETLDREFLPYSRRALQAMCPTLQAREQLIRRSSNDANTFWLASLLFRKHYFPALPSSAGPCAGVPGGDRDDDGGPLPFETLRFYVHYLPNDAIANVQVVRGAIVELGALAFMTAPETAGLGACLPGDTWEAKIDRVDVYSLMVVLTPLRLVERTER